jgi:hypothetical protein
VVLVLSTIAARLPDELIRLVVSAAGFDYASR